MADILPEKWMRGVAVTTTVLAVLTAIVSSQSAATGAKIQFLTTAEAGKWGYYQAKSIKQTISESMADEFEIQIVGTSDLAQKETLEKKLAAYRENIARYDKEKTAIQKEAIDTGKEGALLHRKEKEFGLSIVFFQIGIMLSSVSALLKRKEMWVFGVLFGLVAAFYLANGLLLFL